ncbi:MAG: carboxypeptidase regulatory-like domain-containing protein [Acidobacteria bacterium]|nr:carboxypeptidase regulatory-like domain-containing protein [Acidobacteriota bacterium]
MKRLVTLLIVAMLAVPVLAVEMTKIQVKVTNLDGKPIDRASVIVRFVSGRSVVKLGKGIITHWEMRTNQEGVAKIPALPQGKFQVQVIAKGYQTFGDSFEVDEPEKTLEVKLNPPQPQYSAH